MTHRILSLALAAALTGALALPPAAAAAECYADYKAKQDDPLRLHYGVAQITGPCAKGPAQAELAPRLERHGWVLLTVLSVFGPEGLAERRANAGANYLRF